ncbi:MAG: diguanylate cyclase domain-containing protein, partial [Actinomycetota bacterium]
MNIPEVEFKHIHLYVAALSAAGLALLAVVMGGTAGMTGIDKDLTIYWFVVGCVFLGELIPITLPRRGEVETTTKSTATAFSYALLLTSGAGVAIVAQSVASLIADMVRRKPLWKAGFNAAQYTVSLGASAAVLHALTGVPHGHTPHFSAGDMPGIVVSALVYMVVNHSLIQVATALSTHTSIMRTIRRDWPAHATITGVMLALSPIVVIAAERHLLMTVLVTLPIAAVYYSARASVENRKLAQTLRESAENNEYQALHDALTGLPNRTLFHDRVQQAILSARREGSFLGLMIMDLDRFKEINDALGHHNGDMLL